MAMPCPTGLRFTFGIPHIHQQLTSNNHVGLNLDILHKNTDHGTITLGSAGR